MPSATTRRRRQPKKTNVLSDFTIRDFSGGWNAVDSDLNLSSKFSKRLINMHRSVDGGNEVRPGTKLFADCSDFIDEIVHSEYYSAHIIVVGQNGNIAAIDANGKVGQIWSDDRAAKLPGSPSGWSNNTIYASSTVFNGNLIVCNGLNKPLSISRDLTVTYLNDLATGSNVNVPICRYVAAQGRYLLMAGDPNNVDRLYISSTDVAIWVGDDAPNDAVNIDLGSRVSLGSDVIKGIGKFRTNVVVAFEDVLLPGTLGVFTEDDHTPTFNDSIENHGSLAHKTIQTIGEDMFFCDAAGVTSVERALFTGNVRAERFSQLVDPEIQSDIDRVSLITTLEDRVFSVYDAQFSNYMLFIPNSGELDAIIKYRCYVLKKNDSLKIEAWADWRDWNFRSGCRSSGKRIFLTEGAEVFILGELHNIPVRDQTPGNEIIPRDYMGVEETWDDDTPYADGHGFTPVADEKDSGVPIYFEWLLPWADNDARFMVKNSRYINFDTEGDQTFTCEMYTDSNFEDRGHNGEVWEEDSLLFDDGLGFDVEALDPTLSMTFIGGDAPGYGTDEFGQRYGGGRSTRTEKLYAWVTKYKLFRLRMTGYAIKPLKFSAISMAFTGGSIRR
jgi:hypothetical protein